jgi:Cu+-exporting ATPase
MKEYWLDQYRGFFRLLIFGLSLPSFFYSASGYYVAAYKSIRSRMLNIEIPIALGIVIMFVRSVVDITFDYGPVFLTALRDLSFLCCSAKCSRSKPIVF